MKSGLTKLIVAGITVRDHLNREPIHISIFKGNTTINT
jgi:hypothetical protein